jgi:hypothetical protein
MLETKIWVLIATGVSLLLDPVSWQSKEIPINIHIYIDLWKYIYIYSPYYLMLS